MHGAWMMQAMGMREKKAVAEIGRSHRFPVSLPLISFLVLSAAAQARQLDQTPPPAAVPAAEQAEPKASEEPRKRASRPRGVPFTFTIEGLNDSASKDLFKEISVLRQQRDKPARARSELQSWIQRDIKALNDILRAQGFYDNRVSYRLDRKKSPFAVTILVSEGERYKITSFAIRLAGMPDDARGRAEAEGLQALVGRRLPKPGSAAESARVVEAEQRILQRLPEVGYPNVKVKARDIVVDHARLSMDVTLTIEPGPKVFFGEPRFSGAPNVEDRYLSRLAPWKFGDVYDSRQVEEFRKTLSETMLFSGISTAVGEPDALGCVPILVSLAEDKRRSYGIGVSYGSSEGFGVNAFWEHRNFAGAGERLRVEGKAVEIEQSVTALYEIPAFRRSKQWLLFSGGLERESTDAYVSYNVVASAAVKREFRKYWTALVGSSLEFSQVDDGLSQKQYYLLGGQGLVSFDNTNDIFDPRRGSKLVLNFRPYVGEEGGLISFYITELSGSTYWALDRRRRYLIAGRFKLGSILGEDLATIPANKRFYAGGGASVRGYAYQAAGPLDVRGDPVGGRSLIEGALELRARVTDTIGVVPFVEVGSVSDRSLPDFSERFFWGAGLGFRYYTSFAPVRVDVAVPLNKRPTDSSYQIYISLGQSF